MDRESVPNLLKAHFPDGVADFESLASGVFSRAYGFRSAGRDYVLRISDALHAAESFAKDDFAARHYASAALPIPRVVRRGTTAGLAYSVSERVAGKPLAACSPSERAAAQPALLDTLEAVGRSDVSGSRGFGSWDGDGNAPHAGWHAFLAAIIDDEQTGFYRGWRSLFHSSFLERDVYEAGYRRMLRLSEACPDVRGLIHEDYHFENVIVSGRRVTGVIDWANAMYGDPLYDVARLAWWSAQPGWWFADGPAIVRGRFGSAPGYDQRIACYQCHMGLNDLRYYAKTGQHAEYEFFRDRLLALVSDS